MERRARREFFYFTDGGGLAGLRSDRWKFVFMEQLAEGVDVWIEPFDELRVPRIVDLRAHPFERALNESANYDTWWVQHTFLLYPLRDEVRRFYATFVRYPPRQPSGVIGRLQLLIEALGKIAN